MVFSEIFVFVDSIMNQFNSVKPQNCTVRAFNIRILNVESKNQRSVAVYFRFCTLQPIGKAGTSGGAGMGELLCRAGAVSIVLPEATGFIAR